ncbi:MAG: SagB/ThcOx family dehydrogenase [Marinifilaceae bacterium]
MKKILLLTLIITLFGNAFAAEKQIVLTKPNLKRSAQIMDAYSQRQSTREYADKAISVSDLSDLLWAAYGINRPESDKRTAPSAMNKQDMSIYVALPQGTYLYDAKSNVLNLVNSIDLRPEIAGQQQFATTAPAIILLVSDVSKLGDPKLERSMVLAALDAGVISQNISLFCSAFNIGTVPRYYMNIEKIKSILKLTDSQTPMLNHPIGYFKQ